MSTISDNSRNSSDAPAAMMPPPAYTQGRSASQIICAARLICPVWPSVKTL
jgi:hypothetical protein